MLLPSFRGQDPHPVLCQTLESQSKLSHPAWALRSGNGYMEPGKQVVVSAQASQSRGVAGARAELGQ